MIAENKIRESLEETIKARENAADYEDCNIEIDFFNNRLFVCENTEEANEVIKKFLAEKGINVFTVSPNGYEIQRKTDSIRLGRSTVFAILYPGDETTDELKKENVALFLPDLDQMNDLVYRRLLFDVIRTHIVADSRNSEGNFTKLHYSFFAVATVSNKMPKNEWVVLHNEDAKNCFRIVHLEKSKDYK